jgi:LacI family transcriptional regulator
MCRGLLYEQSEADLVVRIKDIARDLGVSSMTVSKALRNQFDISEETRKRVTKRAEELGYQPNLVARGLVTRRTYMVGMVVPDLRHSFFAEVIKGATNSLKSHGYHVVILDSDGNVNSEAAQIETLLALNIDGLIIASAQSDGRRLRRTLEKNKIPYVLVDRTIAGVKAHYVGVDDEEIGAIATWHLIEQGCRRIAHIRGPAISNADGREQGYRRTMAEHDLEVLPGYVVAGQHQDTTGHEAMMQLLDLSSRLDGVFCYDDQVASGAITAIVEAGFKVPSDIAVVGAGNVHYSSLLRVPLSTVDQRSTVIGETAGELLAKSMGAKIPSSPERVMITPRLVVRESSLRRR